MGIRIVETIAGVHAFHTRAVYTVVDNILKKNGGGTRERELLYVVTYIVVVLPKVLVHDTVLVCIDRRHSRTSLLSGHSRLG